MMLLAAMLFFAYSIAKSNNMASLYGLVLFLFGLFVMVVDK